MKQGVLRGAIASTDYVDRTVTSDLFFGLGVR